MTRVYDRQLLDALESLGGISLNLTAWRVAWSTRSCLQGGSGPGRWNPAKGFEALYTSLDMDGAVAEVYHHLSQHPVTSSADKTLHKLSLRTQNTLVLTDTAMAKAIGITHPIALSPIERCQEIGAAAHLLEYDSLLVPSARWQCDNLVILVEHFDGSAIHVEESSPMNFPAWREKRAEAYEVFQTLLRKARSQSR